MKTKLLIHCDRSHITIPPLKPHDGAHGKMALNPINLSWLNNKFTPEDFDDSICKEIDAYQCAVSKNSIRLLEKDEVIEIQLRFEDLDERAIRKLSYQNVVWQPIARAWQIPADAFTFVCWAHFMNEHFGAQSAFKTIHDLLDESNIMNLTTQQYAKRINNLKRRKRIRLAFDQSKLWFFFPYNKSIVHSFQEAGGTWRSKMERWELPTDVGSRRIALKLQGEDFDIDKRTQAFLAQPQDGDDFQVTSTDGKVYMSGVIDEGVLSGLRKDKRAKYRPAQDDWEISLDRENSYLIIKEYNSLISAETRKLLGSWVHISDPLELASEGGKVIFEEDQKVPNGLAIILGEKLSPVCKPANIDYKPVIAYGPRPYPTAIGIAIRGADLETFKNAYDAKLNVKEAKALDAFNRFQNNNNRTKLLIHVDATEYTWAVCVLNGSKEAIHTFTGEVTVKPRTINTAEYQALIEGLKWLRGHPCKEARVLSDSKVVVDQVRGGSVKTEHLAPLRDEVLKQFSSCNSHTPTSISWQSGRRNRADSPSRGKQNIVILKN